MVIKTENTSLYRLEYKWGIICFKSGLTAVLKHIRAS